jgi:hypothetical protein
MRNFFGLTVALAIAVSAATGATAPTAKKKNSSPKTAVRRPSATAHAATASVRRPAVTAASAASRRKKASAPVKTAVTWRNRQLAPTSGRYREIQEALAAKGYLQPEQATGAWDQNSAEALKRFQAEQNIASSGKINSLSLIALGLGPKHDALPTQISISASESINR